MSTSFTATGYEHINRGGLSRLFGLGSSARYNMIRNSLLSQLSFDVQMSSMQVAPSSTSVATAILFSNTEFGWVNVGDFSGDFVEIAVPKSGSPDFRNLTDLGFNDRTRSLLLVNASRGPEFRISFRDTFLDTWNSTIDKELGTKASRKGDPLMTWAAFPENISYLSPDQTYLSIQQRLNINIDWWPDYDARIGYFLYLYLDGAGKLQGYVQRWEYWVEGGVKTGGIVDQLKPKVVSGMNTINTTLKERLSSLPAFKSFYYLPGRQLGPVTGVAQGNTWDDVTLVFELKL